MSHVVPATSRAEAWVKACDILVSKKSALNVILAIENPTSDGPESPAIHSRFDSFYEAEGGEEPLHTVAETIFPGWEYTHSGFEGMLRNYPESYDLFKKNAPSRWGTYAERILRRRRPNGEVISPLSILIERMRTEHTRDGGGRMRSCYELGIADNEYEVGLYDTVRDDRRRMGGPCLSHLSFKLYHGTVHLTAMYRSHDYRLKVPGNLLGLARLQACVAAEVGAPIGTLVVHSTYAYIDGALGSLEGLVADIRALLAKTETT